MRGRFDRGLYSKSSREAAPVFVIILKWQGRIEKKRKREREREKKFSLVFTDIPTSSMFQAHICFRTCA